MSITDLAATLRTELEGRVEEGVQLAPLTTYRLGGPAAVFIEPASPEDLERMGEALRSRRDDVPVLALGRGSNTVFSDDGVPGIIIRMSGAFSWIEPHEANGLDSGASTSLPLLGNWAARRGLSGMEFTVGIPGSVGGAVRMNAGAHGQEIADSLVSVRTFSLESFALERREAAALDLTYRHSNRGAADLVVDARFELQPKPEPDIRARMEDYRRHRAETQPGALQNAGSVFKNPPGDSAGRLVEAAGLKGFRVGGAAVSELHANFFVASEAATAQDVYDLVGAVKTRVQERFGIELVPEVRFVGRFDEHSGVAGRSKS
jgi:UDP-N-acetylmuramate dehydrogenase